MRIGLIADTHGLLRDEALAALRGSDRILHAGDIGDPGILDALAAIAPVDAVRGNNDTAPWAAALPDVLRVEACGIAIHLLHDIKTLATWPPTGRVDVIVAGHSHRPRIERRDGVLHVNPGSAGRRRFSLPVSVGILHLDAGGPTASIVELGA
ncbi:MAG: metallophosphoesterase family protein [Pseudomonadota bacterium]